MTKLTYSQATGTFTINKKRPFVDHPIELQHVLQAIEFAHQMVYGEGHHRDHRTGGSIIRRRGEKFCNTFQGKLAEIVLRALLMEEGITVSELDFGIHGEGIWDDCDIIANEKRINVKSAAGFSNLLLLETRDWDRDGNYLPNMRTGNSEPYDYFVLVRFRPDIKGVFLAKRMFLSDALFSLDDIREIVLGHDWYYDIGGCISNRSLRHLIEQGYILAKGASLNGTEMDASNIYVQTGSMARIEALVEKLKEEN